MPGNLTRSLHAMEIYTIGSNACSIDAQCPPGLCIFGHSLGIFCRACKLHPDYVVESTQCFGTRCDTGHIRDRIQAVPHKEIHSPFHICMHMYWAGASNNPYLAHSATHVARWSFRVLYGPSQSMHVQSANAMVVTITKIK